MYIGDNKMFAAHGSSLPKEDQVSVTAFNYQGSLFCRPSK